ncbi:hypothetical protein [Henriciella aquimarina]|uniref:hypothetical protein n=1 Tax=Henriciella aquimarina TaxID=545261 RepID=UPI000A067FDB|nr:hypothetical protein [Henriciella aquimarina]
MSETQAQSARADKKDQEKAGDETVSEHETLDVLMDYDPVKAMDIGGANMDHLFSISQELASFWADRIRKNVSVFHGLSDCRTPEDYMTVMAKAASETVHDFANEFDRMVAINLERPE